MVVIVYVYFYFLHLVNIKGDLFFPILRLVKVA